MGIDCSLSKPAAIVIPREWAPASGLAWLPRREGILERKEEHVLDRMARIAEMLTDFAREQDVDRVYIEQYAYNQMKQANHAVLIELGGVVKRAFWVVRRETLEPVIATQARKLLVGKLPRSDSKVYVHQQLYAMGAPHEWGGDACDAFVVANWGRHAMGWQALAFG